MKRRKSNQKQHYSKITTDHLLHSKVAVNNDHTNDVIDATVYHLTNDRNFGRRNSKKKRRHSFGNVINQTHLKKFLIIAFILLLRSVIKKNPNSIKIDIESIENGALNFLTVSSILELIEHVFGAKVRDKVMLGYIVFSIGLDISDLV